MKASRIFTGTWPQAAEIRVGPRYTSMAARIRKATAATTITPAAHNATNHMSRLTVALTVLSRGVLQLVQSFQLLARTKRIRIDSRERLAQAVCRRGCRRRRNLLRCMREQRQIG